MRKILICSALLLSLNVSNAAFVSEKEKTPTQQAATSSIPINAITQPANEIVVGNTEQVKQKKLSFKEKIILKLFKKKLSAAAAGKSQLTALLLALFVGVLGIHRFYLGYTWQGIVQLLTLGGFGIWALIDLIRIITGDLKPKGGEYETTL